MASLSPHLQLPGNPITVHPRRNTSPFPFYTVIKTTLHPPKPNNSKWICSYTTPKPRISPPSKVYRRQKPRNPASEEPISRTTTPLNVDPRSPKPSEDVIDLVSLCNDGKVEEAIGYIGQGVPAGHDVFVSLLDACQSLEMCKKVHGLLRRSPFAGDIGLCNKLVQLYGEYGSVRDARMVFDRMRERKDMCSWHLLMNAYAANGQGRDGLLLVEEMKAFGLKLNEDSFSAVFSVCASALDVEQGLLQLESMRKEYDIVPGIRQYVEVIDIFGSAGYLDEAVEFVERMPIEPTVEIWEAVKNIARIHGDLELEDHMEELMLTVDPSRAIENKILTRKMMEAGNQKG
ncbi:Pentatricopeptide repeat-containing protein At2g15690, mitochondrial [Linum perenne]